MKNRLATCWLFRCATVALVAIAVIALVHPAQAEVRLPGLFSDHMVLQAGVPAPIWGLADAGESVTVIVNDQRYTTTADGDGAWQVRLQPVSAGTPLSITVQASNTIKIHNAVAGEIWLCAGQSQMEHGMGAMPDRHAHLKNAEDPLLRLFVVPRISAEAPLDLVEGQWVVCTPESLVEVGWRGFSAIGYFFGSRLRQELDVPVGMIQAAIGGTPIEVWMDWNVLGSTPVAQNILEEWKRKVASYNPERARAAYEKRLAQWRQQAAEAQATGDEPPARPAEPRPPTRELWYPASRYNAMIAPVAPYGIRGVLWYQGYSSRFRAEAYKTLFPLLIRSWRELWGQGDFPFYYVQHANFATRGQEAQRQLLAQIREAQLAGLSEPNTAMVVTIDVGHSQYLHYANKRPVAQRLANIALAETYGRELPVVYHSPLFRQATFDGQDVLVRFDHVGAGLKTRDGGPIGGFEVAGEDQRFVPAQAQRVTADQVRVWSDEVSRPVAVRYAWADDPAGANLCNDAGLPAAPFRADDDHSQGAPAR